MSARNGAYSVRISGGVVVLSPVEPPFGWDAAGFQRDVGVVARLAESAPDLLAACEALVKWEERAEDRECRAALGQMIRAAIAKTRGQ